MISQAGRFLDNRININSNTMVKDRTFDQSQTVDANGYQLETGIISVL